MWVAEGFGDPVAVREPQCPGLRTFPSCRHHTSHACGRVQLARVSHSQVGGVVDAMLSGCRLRSVSRRPRRISAEGKPPSWQGRSRSGKATLNWHSAGSSQGWKSRMARSPSSTSSNSRITHRSRRLQRPSADSSASCGCQPTCELRVESAPACRNYLRRKRHDASCPGETRFVGRHSERGFAPGRERWVVATNRHHVAGQ